MGATSASRALGLAELVVAPQATAAAEQAPTRTLDIGAESTPRVAHATTGDHAEVHELLTTVFQAPPRDAFLASLDDPHYEPRDRLLVKRGAQLVAHAQLSKRVMHFGALRLPIDSLAGMATLPEFRGNGLGRRLLAAAEEAMVRDGARLGVLSTSIPHFFRATGWAVCGRHSHAQAGSRELLAQLSARGFPLRETTISIRPWRQVELPALMRLYEQNAAHAAGALQRTEAYWRWLVSRRAFDRIYVAVDGPDKLDLETSVSQIVGYMVTKDERVVELMAAPEHPTVAAELLARACSEAIERDCHRVTLHAPPCDPLFEIFQLAGGVLHHHEAHQGEVFMVKLLDPVGFLRELCPELHQRAERARLPRPCELGLCVDADRFRLVVSRRSVKLTRNKIGRSYLRLNQAELTRLLLGHTDITEAISRGRIRASTRLALDSARTLFPRLPLWRPPLDELM